MTQPIYPADLVSARDIAERCGVTHSAVGVWRFNYPKTFPKPVYERRTFLLYDWNEIHAWLIRTGRWDSKKDEYIPTSTQRRRDVLNGSL
jgi:predicted DNA-binding transcriptional regulator AlpA